MGTLQADAARMTLSLRRIDAELRGLPLLLQALGPPDVGAQVLAQYRARRQGYNRTRLRSMLAHVSPVQFKENWRATQPKQANS